MAPDRDFYRSPVAPGDVATLQQQLRVWQWAPPVLTAGLIDEPGEPTRDALDQVLALFRRKLLGEDPTTDQ